MPGSAPSTSHGTARSGSAGAARGRRSPSPRQASALMGRRKHLCSAAVATGLAGQLAGDLEPRSTTLAGTSGGVGGAVLRGLHARNRALGANGYAGRDARSAGPGAGPVGQEPRWELSDGGGLGGTQPDPAGAGGGQDATNGGTHGGTGRDRPTAASETAAADRLAAQESRWRSIEDRMKPALRTIGADNMVLKAELVRVQDEIQGRK